MGEVTAGRGEGKDDIKAEKNYTKGMKECGESNGKSRTGEGQKTDKRITCVDKGKKGVEGWTKGGGMRDESGRLSQKTWGGKQ